MCTLGENFTDEEVIYSIDKADRDGDGEINIDEFYQVISSIHHDKCGYYAY